MSRSFLPSTRKLACRYKRILQLAQAEDVLDHGRLMQVLNHLEEEANRHSTVEKGEGRLTVPPTLALSFIKTDLRGFKVYPDIYFTHTWSDADPYDPFVELDLKVRIWVPGNASARPSIDHPDLASHDWRVGLRIHFDRRGDGQQAPRYHFQVGGKPEANELCQIYEKISEPRIPIWPIDFALALQMILKGFFPLAYNRLILKDEFCGYIRESEQQFVKPVHDWVGRHLSGGTGAGGRIVPGDHLTLLDYFDG